jgi:hypothetical protein
VLGGMGAIHAVVKTTVRAKIDTRNVRKCK